MHTPTVDLRSDTVTQPTPEMLRAMVEAPLGDDVFRDDPTVLALEEEAAALVGKEAALFVPSGTMANNIGIAVSTRPGDEILLMRDAHTFLYEVGGSARLWGVHAHPLDTEDGCPTVEQIEAAICPDDPHCPRTTLLLLENSHNLRGGRVVPPERMAEVATTCRAHGLGIHLDGARLFNSVVASGRPATDFTNPVDTVSFCFSKGLRCPVGSVVAGSREAIAEGLRIRKLLGGGMRQAGVLAAAAREALRTGIDRLAEDHARAARLARELDHLPGFRATPPDTNIVMLEAEPECRPRLPELVSRLEAAGVGSMVFMGRCIRLVTHGGIDDAGVDHALRAFQDVLAD